MWFRVAKVDGKGEILDAKFVQHRKQGGLFFQGVQGLGEARPCVLATLISDNPPEELESDPTKVRLNRRLDSPDIETTMDQGKYRVRLVRDGPQEAHARIETLVETVSPVEISCGQLAGKGISRLNEQTLRAKVVARGSVRVSVLLHYEQDGVTKAHLRCVGNPPPAGATVSFGPSSQYSFVSDGSSDFILEAEVVGDDFPNAQWVHTTTTTDLSKQNLTLSEEGWQRWYAYTSIGSGKTANVLHTVDGVLSRYLYGNVDLQVPNGWSVKGETRPTAAHPVKCFSSPIDSSKVSLEVEMTEPPQLDAGRSYLLDQINNTLTTPASVAPRVALEEVTYYASDGQGFAYPLRQTKDALFNVPITIGHLDLFTTRDGRTADSYVSYDGPGLLLPYPDPIPLVGWSPSGPFYREIAPSNLTSSDTKYQYPLYDSEQAASDAGDGTSHPGTYGDLWGSQNVQEVTAKPAEVGPAPRRARKVAYGLDDGTMRWQIKEDSSLAITHYDAGFVPVLSREGDLIEVGSGNFSVVEFVDGVHSVVNFGQTSYPEAGAPLSASDIRNLRRGTVKRPEDDVSRRSRGRGASLSLQGNMPGIGFVNTHAGLTWNDDGVFEGLEPQQAEQFVVGDSIMVGNGIFTVASSSPVRFEGSQALPASGADTVVKTGLVQILDNGIMSATITKAAFDTSSRRWRHIVHNQTAKLLTTSIPDFPTDDANFTMQELSHSVLIPNAVTHVATLTNDFSNDVDEDLIRTYLATDAGGTISQIRPGLTQQMLGGRNWTVLDSQLCLFDDRMHLVGAHPLTNLTYNASRPVVGQLRYYASLGAKWFFVTETKTTPFTADAMALCSLKVVPNSLKGAADLEFGPIAELYADLSLDFVSSMADTAAMSVIYKREDNGVWESVDGRYEKLTSTRLSLTLERQILADQSSTPFLFVEQEFIPVQNMYRDPGSGLFSHKTVRVSRFETDVIEDSSNLRSRRFVL